MLLFVEMMIWMSGMVTTTSVDARIKFQGIETCNFRGSHHNGGECSWSDERHTRNEFFGMELPSLHRVCILARVDPTGLLDLPDRHAEEWYGRCSDHGLPRRVRDRGD